MPRRNRCRALSSGAARCSSTVTEPWLVAPSSSTLSVPITIPANRIPRKSGFQNAPLHGRGSLLLRPSGRLEQKQSRQDGDRHHEAVPDFARDAPRNQINRTFERIGPGGHLALRSTPRSGAKRRARTKKPVQTSTMTAPEATLA